MILYRYFATHAYETLAEKLIKLSSIRDFNDPFEFLVNQTGEMTRKRAKRTFASRMKTEEFYNAFTATVPNISSKKEMRKYLRKKEIRERVIDQISKKKTILNDPFKIRDLADRTWKVCCFSSDQVDEKKEILLWSHYANKHQGVRLGFEFVDLDPTKFSIREVTYSDFRVPADSTLGFDNPAIEKSLTQMISTKSTAWNYEKEWRLLIRLEKREIILRTIGDKKIAMLPYNSSCLKMVDFGLNCARAEIAKIVDLVKKDFPKAKMRMTGYHPTDYSLIYEDLK